MSLVQTFYTWLEAVSGKQNQLMYFNSSCNMLFITHQKAAPNKKRLYLDQSTYFLVRYILVRYVWPICLYFAMFQLQLISGAIFQQNCKYETQLGFIYLFEFLWMNLNCQFSHFWWVYLYDWAFNQSLTWNRWMTDWKQQFLWWKWTKMSFNLYLIS